MRGRGDAAGAMWGRDRSGGVVSRISGGLEKTHSSHMALCFCHAPNPTCARSSFRGRKICDVPESVADPNPKSEGHAFAEATTHPYENIYMTKGRNHNINKHSYKNPRENLQIPIQNIHKSKAGHGATDVKKGYVARAVKDYIY